MSLFKEKDDFITKAFLEQFNHDSEEDEPEEGTDLDESQELVAEQSSASEPNLDVVNQPPIIKQDSPNYECIDLDCEVDDNTRSSRPNNESLEDQVITISSSDDDGDIDIDSSNIVTVDESFQKIPNPPQTHNVSQDMDDHVYNLKLTLAGSYKQFCTTYKTRLNETLEVLLTDISARGKSLIVTANGRTISLDESPYSLKLKPGSILAAFEIADSSVSNPDEITVKLQDGNRKHTKEYKITKNEPMLKLKQRYAREFEIQSIDTIRFCFDGDMVEDDSTPEELDIEDDCIIDVMFF